MHIRNLEVSNLVHFVKQIYLFIKLNFDNVADFFEAGLLQILVRLSETTMNATEQ